ncbi:helix-turn-helix transcriptional regulator [Methylobacterium sp. Leaf466]|uniref:helix-turn-helix transcriptional regulator n=1 Tax=Methylobacterium sp. Leaf466 TaxID=1736386 RepID=UPI000AB4E200|nr:helix-turn-helix transcriptional regulator [Methylobacterium sp. Leaf466]
MVVLRNQTRRGSVADSRGHRRDESAFETLVASGQSPRPGSLEREGARVHPGSALLEALGRLGCGTVILNHLGAVQAMNAQGRAVLGQETALVGEAAADDGAIAGAVSALLARGARRLGLGVDDWTVVAREGRRPLLLRAVPIAQAGGERSDTALLLIDLDRPVAPDRFAMEQVFDLTPAEARLTILLTGGASPSEAAAAQGVSLATVRKQLVSIFGKTRTRGQVELVALASRLAGLP